MRKWHTQASAIPKPTDGACATVPAMHFDLTDLRLFVNVHEAGTITGGAGRSHLALASASERIRGMEDALGTPLLVRGQRGVHPTAAGHTLLHHARLVLRQMEHLRGDLGDYGAGVAGHVRLLCNTSALSEHLPRALAGFLARHPRTSVELEERASPDIADAVRAGLCDLGVVSDAADLQGLVALPWRPDPLVLAVPKGHALAGARAVRLADAAGLDFIGLAEDSALQALVAQQARRLGWRPRYRVRVRHLEAVCQLVGLGCGVAVVPRAAAARHARTLRVRPLRLADDWAARTLVLCMRDREALPGPARQLVRHLQEDMATAVPKR